MAIASLPATPIQRTQMLPLFEMPIDATVDVPLSTTPSDVINTPIHLQSNDTHKSSPSNVLLTHLSEDVFLEIAGQWLELPDILVLRKVSKRLYALTRMRELWIALALRLVVEKRLPWPQYALPLVDMPARTIERLTFRSVRMHQLWDNIALDATRARGPSGLIRCGKGLVTWLHIVRSKWLVIGSRDCSLALWDIENLVDQPVATYVGTEGRVLSGVTQFNEHRLTLTVNTHGDHTYCFDMDLPFLGEPYTNVLRQANFVIKTSFAGYSTILDDYKGLLAFSRSTDENLPVIYDRSRNMTVRLLRGKGVIKLQSAVEIHIRPDIVVVAKDWNVELYSTEAVMASLESPDSDSKRAVQPLQSLSYPGDKMLWKLGINRTVPMANASHPAPIIINAFFLEGWHRWTIQTQDNQPTSYTFSGNTLHREPVDYAIVKICWGESGTRISYIGEPEDDPAALCSFAFPTSDQEGEGGEIVRWILPFEFRDFPWLFEVDEAAGISVVSTACGRIWIFDPSWKEGYSHEMWATIAIDATGVTPDRGPAEDDHDHTSSPEPQ